MTVRYEGKPPKDRRYQVEFFQGRWVRQAPGYRTYWNAWLGAKSFQSIGYAARVIDTRK